MLLSYILSTTAIAIIIWGVAAFEDIVELWLFYFPLALVVFTPAYIPTYFLCKKVKQTYLKLFIIAFNIPFFNLIYFYLESFMSADEIYSSCLLGASWLFVILPAMLFAALFIPKKILKMKKEYIITIYLTFVFGWGLIGLTIPIEKIKNVLFPVKRTWLWNPITTHRLEHYRPTINYIENYKLKNGVYPETIPVIVPVSSFYPHYTYATYNNSNDFILTVSEYKYMDISGYKYCSSKTLPYCSVNANDTDRTILFKLGNWVYYRILFD